MAADGPVEVRVTVDWTPAFEWLVIATWNSRLDVAEKAVLTVLITSVVPWRDSFRVRLTVAVVAAHASISERTARRALGRLVAAGLVRRDDEAGRPSSFEVVNEAIIRAGTAPRERAARRR